MSKKRGPLYITNNELEVLKGIANSQYQDGAPVEARRVIWTWDVMDYLVGIPNRSHPGIVASLTRKGMVNITRKYGRVRHEGGLRIDSGEDATIQMTEKGVEAYRGAQP